MIVERIETADLNAAVYRTARRLLDLCNQQTGAARVTHAEMRTIAGTDADGTARNHLHQLQAAGILTYRRDGDVRIWFADWLPGNIDHHDDQQSTVVHSGARTACNLHTGARVECKTEHDSVHSGARVECKSRATRANCTPDVHSPHTYASAPDLDGRKEDPITDQINPSIPADPEPQTDEAALALRLLLAAKVTKAEAAPLAASVPFERVRECVGSWWMNRKKVGGKLENDPGIVVHWLKTGKPCRDFDEREWQRTDLYLAHRTPLELVADQSHAEPPTLPPPVVAQSPPRAYLDTDPAWLAIAADEHAASELAGLVAVGAVDGVPLYRLVAKDAARLSWLNQKMATRLRRLIASAVGHPVLVEFIGATE